MNLFDYLFVENCRKCKEFVAPQYSMAKTLCNACWSPLVGGPAQIDLCESENECGRINVAHGVAYEDAMKLLIYKLKYDSDRLIADDLVVLLAKAYELILQSMPIGSVPCLMPVPLSRWRKLKRGFNQSEILAQKLSKIKKVPLVADLLKRHKHTKPQHDLIKAERVVNLQGAFSCAPGKLVPDNILIVDDIHTSGATLAEAARTLYLAGAKNVGAITVARALLK